MRRLLSCAALVLAAPGLAGQAAPSPPPAPPAPDIFLVGVRIGKDGIVATGEVRNLTNRPGYDNQPSWAPDGRSIFYTSTREDAQADVYRIAVAGGAATRGNDTAPGNADARLAGGAAAVRVTATAPESEYSAAVLPDGKSIAVIRVERDSAQRLWRLPLGNGEPHVILPALKPAGYFAFANANTVLLFVLGTPNALVLADVKKGSADTLARNVGRSLHRVPKTGHLSFVSKLSEDAWWIVDLDPKERTMRQLALLPKGVEDYAWTPDGHLVAGDGSRLLWWNGSAWVDFADLTAHGLTGITRLAVSPKGEWIAVVAIPR